MPEVSAVMSMSFLGWSPIENRDQENRRQTTIDDVERIPVLFRPLLVKNRKIGVRLQRLSTENWGQTPTIREKTQNDSQAGSA